MRKWLKIASFEISSTKELILYSSIFSQARPQLEDMEDMAEPHPDRESNQASKVFTTPIVTY